MNTNFQNAIAQIPQSVPPVWLMRQAGRYHRHYQSLKEKYSFMELCKVPELAAQVALGPIQDFDFDVAILFSDLLFPLEALGFGLVYDPGPKLDRVLDRTVMSKLSGLDEAADFLEFQREAVELTRAALPKNKSLVGFVGGPWTLYSYAVGGGHDGNLIAAKTDLDLYRDFSTVLISLLKKNIALQLDGGAEIIMIFDTAAGELSPAIYRQYVIPGLMELAAAFPKKLGYYSKGTHYSHIEKLFADSNWAGHGVDHRHELSHILKIKDRGFVQGNFDQALLFCEPAELGRQLSQWLSPIADLPPEVRAGWVCGLGHGVLPKTPEANVKRFVQYVRSELSR